MKKLPKISKPGRKKGSYKPVAGSFGWDLGKIVFTKEEGRNKKCVIVDKIVDK